MIIHIVALKLCLENAHLSIAFCEPDADSNAGSHDQIRKYLSSCVDPDRAVERQDSDRKSAKGEENTTTNINLSVRTTQRVDLQKRERH